MMNKYAKQPSNHPLIKSTVSIGKMLLDDYNGTIEQLESMSWLDARTLLWCKSSGNDLLSDTLWVAYISFYDSKNLLGYKPRMPKVKSLPELPAYKIPSEEEMLSDPSFTKKLIHYKPLFVGEERLEFPIVKSTDASVPNLRVKINGKIQSENLKTAYEEHLKTKYVHETYHRVLTEILRKTNDIQSDPVELEKMPLLLQLMVSMGHWDLLSEWLIHMGVYTWENMMTYSAIENLLSAAEFAMKTENSSGHEGIIRFLSLIRERAFIKYSKARDVNRELLYREMLGLNQFGKKIHLYFDDHMLILGFPSISLEKMGTKLSYYFKDAGQIRVGHVDVQNLNMEQLHALFQNSGRVERVAVLMAISPTTRETLLSQLRTDKKCLPLLFMLKEFVSEPLHSLWQMDFAWMSKINISVELEQNPEEFGAVLDRLIGMEMFRAAEELLKPLSNAQKILLLSKVSEESWSKAAVYQNTFVAEIKEIFLSTPTQEFERFLDASPMDILSFYMEKFLEIHPTLDLYLCHHEAFESRPRFQESIRQMMAVVDQNQLIFKPAKDNFRFIKNAILLNKTVETYVSDPGTFIELLNSGNESAYHIFLSMNENQRLRLLKGLEDKNISLLETLVSYHVFAPQSKNFDKKQLNFEEEKLLSIPDAFGGYQIKKDSELKSDSQLYKSYQYSGMIYRANLQRWEKYKDNVLYLNKKDEKNNYSEELWELVSIQNQLNSIQPFTRKMILDLSRCLPIDYAFKHPENDAKLINRFLGLIIHPEQEIMQLIMRVSSPDWMRRIFKIMLGKERINAIDESHRELFINWLSSHHSANHPLASLFSGLDSDAIKAWLAELDPQLLTQALVKILTKGGIPADLMKQGCFAVARMDFPSKIFDRVFNNEIAQVLLNSHCLPYGKALHSIDPQYFEEQYPVFHEAMKEVGFSDSEINTFLYQLSTILSPPTNAYPPMAYHEYEQSSTEDQLPIAHSPSSHAEASAPTIEPIIEVSKPSDQSDIVQRLASLEQQMAQQNILMQSFISMFAYAKPLLPTQPLASNPDALQEANQRIYELEVEAAHRRMIEEQEKERQIIKELRIMKFTTAYDASMQNRSKPEENKIETGLKRSKSFG